MAEIQNKVSGKRYSKMVERTYEDIADLMADLGEWKSSQDQVAELVEGAREFLRSRDLPDCPQIMKSRSTGAYQCYEGHATAEISGMWDLDQYILKVCQLKRDSFEHLAARVIVAALEMQRPERERAIEGAVQLGQLSVLTRVYAMVSRHMSDIGGAAKRREWAERLAEYLVTHGARNNAAARDMIPDSYSPLLIDEDHKVYFDGAKIVCIDTVSKAEIGSMTWESFEKRYLREKIGGLRR